ncbi:MAG: 50S ribosomal protein L23 [Chloracidobacterium sp.]|nr:50S ribosomal protein L23 [Chloracidobacterium sp.]MDW8217299.1 50S ribosomal protein L23 [Acidobacteriota bacterium]
MDILSVIKSPVVSEKALVLKEQSASPSQVLTFRVHKKSTKLDIKRAVEFFFNVKVQSVNTANFRGKKVRRGRYQGKKSDWKKAYVTLAPGHVVGDYLESL